MRRSYFWVVSFFLFCIGCNSTKIDNKKASESLTYKSVAVEKYHDNIEYLFNTSKTFVICLKSNKPTPQIPQNQVRFFVYDLATEEIILEESLVGGEVSWKNDHEVRVKTTPGILTTDEEYNQQLTGYIFDVQERKKL